MSEEFLQVGKIVNTHGVNGEVRVIRMTDFPERFNVGNTLYVQKNGETIPLKIKSHRTHKQFDLLQFEGYDEMESVKQLMQLHLHIKKRDRKSTRLNSSHVAISYAVVCLKERPKE